MGSTYRAECGHFLQAPATTPAACLHPPRAGGGGQAGRAASRHTAGERHSSELAADALQVPGVCKTVWADPKKASAWQSTQMDIEGRRPLQEERKRRLFTHG